MFSFQSKIRYSEVDSRGRLTESALLDYFQDCSVFQSEENDIGVDFLKEKNLAWVLYSWHICVEHLPLLGEVVEIQTWPYGMKGFYGYRNFVMKDSQGDMLAWADSVWILMDLEGGRPFKIPDFFAELYGLEQPLPMEQLGRRVEVLPNGEAMEAITVPSYFIDTNQHMNNSKYMLVAKECLSMDFQMKEVQVEYRKAALQGDVIYPVVARTGNVVTVALNQEDGKSYAVVKFIEATE